MEIFMYSFRMFSKLMENCIHLNKLNSEINYRNAKSIWSKYEFYFSRGKYLTFIVTFNKIKVIWYELIFFFFNNIKHKISFLAYKFNILSLWPKKIWLIYVIPYIKMAQLKKKETKLSLWIIIQCLYISYNTQIKTIFILIHKSSLKHHQRRRQDVLYFRCVLLKQNKNS